MSTAHTNLVVWFWYPTPLPATGKRSDQCTKTSPRPAAMPKTLPSVVCLASAALTQCAGSCAEGKAPFRGRLDLDKIGAVGHSLGGASAAQFCHDDARCAAGVDMDGRLFGTVVTEGAPAPVQHSRCEARRTSTTASS